MIKKQIAINKDKQFLNTENLPLLGKIQVLRLDSTTLADLYTFTQNQYQITTNPVYTNASGRVSSDIFVNTGIYLVKEFEYIGEITPSADTNDSNWKYIREYYIGIEDTLAQDATETFTISNLRNINPSEKYVWVTGYWTENDCEPRLYIWDENSTDNDDCGYVIKSNVKETGAWILLYNKEYLPSTYYGVYEDKEENINYLVGYNPYVGSFRQKTAPGIYFKQGSYGNSSIGIITDKKLLLDSDTCFNSSYIKCTGLRVEGIPTHWIGDFEVENGTVHSSWFKTVNGFWSSKAQHFIIDNKNYFTNKTFSKAQIELKNCIIEGSTNLGSTFNSGCSLKLNGCSFIGSHMFGVNDRLQIVNTEVFVDTIIYCAKASDYDFGLLSKGHKLEIRPSSAGNTINIKNFKQALIWFDLMKAFDVKEFDFEGRSILSDTQYTQTGANVSFKNANFTKRLSINALQVSFTNCTCSEIYATVDNVINLYATDSNLKFYFLNNFAYMQFKNCNISSTYGKINLTKTKVYCYDTYFNVSADLGTQLNESDRTKKYKVANIFYFIRSTYNSGNILTTNFLVSEDSKFEIPITIYPYYNSTENNKEIYKLYMEFNRCNFISGAKITIKSHNYSYDSAYVNEITGKFKIKNCKFEQIDPYGVYMPYWGQYGEKVFLKVSAMNSSSDYYEFEGCEGNCPGTPKAFNSNWFRFTDYAAEQTRHFWVSKLTHRTNRIYDGAGGGQIPAYPGMYPNPTTPQIQYTAIQTRGYGTAGWCSYLYLQTLNASTYVVDNYGITHSSEVLSGPSCVDNCGDAFLNRLCVQRWTTDNDVVQSNDDYFVQILQEPTNSVNSLYTLG